VSGTTTTRTRAENRPSAGSKLAAAVTAKEPKTSFRDTDRRTKRFLLGSVLTLFATMLVSVYLLPLAYGFTSALKSPAQLTDPNQPILPKGPATFELDGEEYDVYQVPIDGETRELALVRPGRQVSVFVDPADPGTEIEWEGNWRGLPPAYGLDPQWNNFPEVAETLDIARMFRNTAIIAGLGMAGTVISSVLVAYGLTRFNIPFKWFILVTLLAAIILPRAVMLVPSYAVYLRLGWVGTWLPLIIPHFFANAYNVFLLRQFFLTIPRDLDEAAAIDGAGPLRILLTIIVPQAKAAIVAVALFHFFFAWNDFFEPYIYLAGEDELMPISVGLYSFLGLYREQTHLVQAASMIAMSVPIAVFLFGQRFFMRGIDLSGSLK
jgi:multiple sugar transport system permease protein